MERAASVGSLLWVVHSEHGHNHQITDSPVRPRPHSHHLLPTTDHRPIPKVIVTSYESDLENDGAPFHEADTHKLNYDHSILEDSYDDNNSYLVDLEVKTYKRRFYILFIFSITAFMQYCCWNTFGPISTTFMTVFDWTESEIAIMASLDPFTYIFTMYFFSWLMDVKGMRIAMLITLFFMTLGTGLRCVTTNKEYVTWTMALGQFFNGLAGPVTQAAPPLISSIWFPANERTTATAVSSLCGSLGVAISFIIGPTLVKDIPFIIDNSVFTNKSIHDNLLQTSKKYWIPPNMSNNSKEINKAPKTITLLLNENIKEIFKIQRDKWIDFDKFSENTCLQQPLTCADGISIAFWVNITTVTTSKQHLIGPPNLLTDAGIKQKGRFLVSVLTEPSGVKFLDIQFGISKSEIWRTQLELKPLIWYFVSVTWHPKIGMKTYLDHTLISHSQEPILVVGDLNIKITGGNEIHKTSTTAFLHDLMLWERSLDQSEISIVYKVLMKESQENNDFEVIKKERENSIMLLLYGEFGINAILFVFAMLYFPDKPPVPPSLSGHVEREDFVKGLRLLLRNRQFWMLCLIYGITTGVYSGWGAVLNVNLSTFGVTQKEAGWLGFYTVFAGVGAGMLIARCADLLTGKMKLLLLILITAASGFFLWFALLCLRIISFSIDSLYQASIFGGFFVSGTIPIFYELTIEQTYPVAEGTTTGLLTFINNIVTVIFLMVLIIPNVGTVWMNWMLFGACVICIPALALVKTNYNRLDIDIDAKTALLKSNINQSKAEANEINNEKIDQSNCMLADINNNNNGTMNVKDERSWFSSIFFTFKNKDFVKHIPQISFEASLWSVEERKEVKNICPRIQKESAC